MMAATNPISSSIPTSAGKNIMHPNVLWAQRSEVILLSIEVHDCENPKIEIADQQVTFEAYGQGIATGSDLKLYRSVLDLYAPIDVEKSVYHVTPRMVTFSLTKKDQDAGYWPRLLAEKRKPMWLKVDFSQWKDEDEDLEVESPQNPMGGMESMMGGMGGMMGGGGMPNFDMSQFANLGGVGDDEPAAELDSDDEEQEEEVQEEQVGHESR